MDTAKTTREYTYQDILDLPEGKRAEVIDGRWYDIAPPSYIHQKIVSIFTQQLSNYIQDRGRDCEVLPAPFGVFLTDDDRNYLEPDISVICDHDKISDRGCEGAPDLVIEIISPSTRDKDYGTKMAAYKKAGVKEYWIIDDIEDVIVQYFFNGADGDVFGSIHPITEPIRSGLYEDFSLTLTEYI